MQTLTVTEASNKYGVFHQTIRHWIMVGAVAATKDSQGHWHISAADLERLRIVKPKTAKKPARGKLD